MHRKLGGLFFKAILALSIVSVVPVLLVSWYVLRVDSRVLQSEILDKQRNIANRIALLVSEEVNRKVQFFSVFTELHTDFQDHPLLNQTDLEYLQKRDNEIVYTSILTPQGTIKAFSGRKGIARKEALSNWNLIAKTCVEKGQAYIAPIEHQNGQLYLHLALPLRGSYTDPRVSGVLVVKTDLDELEKLLMTPYPDGISVLVANEENHLISYAGTQGRGVGDSAQQTEMLNHLIRSLKDAASAQITIGSEQTVLVSRVQVPSLNWTIFVQQPADAMSKLMSESLLMSPRNILLVLAILAIFVLAVGYWVLMPIIRPVKRLQEVAIKFEQRDDYLPTEKDLIIPDNEIGDLAHVFLHMAVVLFERKAALFAAQQELASMNKELELRVEQRTAELNAATDKLVKAEQLAAIGQMASIISHEIRNPLAVISNAARLIRAIQPPTDPKLIKQFSIIDAEIRQANGIIGEVLGYARNRDMILSTVDLNSYLHDLLVSFPPPHNVHIREQLDTESVLLKVDAEEMKQAIRNLITNACESMPEGGNVTVGTRVGQQVVCIYVGDEGPGISEELKNKIFSPFFTTKARGTGLGLAVVRKAISRHKGKLFVHDNKPKGTLFEIYLKIYTKTGDTRYVG